MNLFDVYNILNITPIKAEGNYIWDEKGEKYLDLYGGNAVISIGHSHPHYVKNISKQLGKIGFYSNSVCLPIQKQLAELLGKISGYSDYQLFLCNSGAEANENALKLASFHNEKKKIISFTKAFHGRTSLAVSATDNANIVAPVNKTKNVIFVEFGNEEELEKTFAENKNEISAVIVECIQGVAGIYVSNEDFLKKIEKLCKENNSIFIADEVQSGYGRTGKFFAHQHFGVKPDIITTAKGMGNGFPVAGVLISPKIQPKKGMLGTTFGGSYLACSASIAVLQVMENENLVRNALEMGNYLIENINNIPKIKEIRSIGLMIGIELEEPCTEIRNTLFKKHKILVGDSANKNTLRILPSLSVSKNKIDKFVIALKTELND